MIDLFAIKLTAAAAIVFVAGGLTTFALYKFRFEEMVKSRLALKIAMWIPLWILYVVATYFWFTAFMVLIVAVFLGEILIKNRRLPLGPRLTYGTIFVIGIFLIVNFIEKSTTPHQTALAIMAACIASDVCAYFGGKLLGKHKLPSLINQRKAWEGVLGQLVGGALGVWGISALGAPEMTLGVALAVGLGSGLGDMTNSYYKRKVGIPEWSNWIPGHGGMGDRFASLAGTGYLLFLVKVIFG